MPSQLEALPARKLVGPIRFCTLDCPDTVLAGRLRRRPSWRGTSSWISRSMDDAAPPAAPLAWADPLGLLPDGTEDVSAQRLRCVTNVFPDASVPLFLTGKHRLRM
jgi:hypothetical protein